MGWGEKKTISGYNIKSVTTHSTQVTWYHWMRQKTLSTVHNIIINCTHCEYSKLNFKIGSELNISKQIKESDLWL